MGFAGKVPCRCRSIFYWSGLYINSHKSTPKIGPYMRAGLNRILGTIAALHWNDEAIRKHFLEAYRFSRHPVVLENYAKALQNIQKMEDAAVVAETASNASPTDLRLLHSALSLAMTEKDQWRLNHHQYLRWRKDYWPQKKMNAAHAP